MDQASAILYTALLLSAVAFVCLIASIVALSWQMRKKAEADMRLEQSRFDFEKRLAYVKTRLEKAANDWRRRAEFAEKSVVDFYEAEEILRSVRTRPNPLLRTFSEYRAVKLAIDARQPFSDQLKLRRLTARALFGSSGSAIYELLLTLFAEIQEASHSLANATYAEQQLIPAKRSELERIIWAATEPNADPVKERLQQIIAKAEDLFWPALEPPLAESAPDP